MAEPSPDSELIPTERIAIVTYMLARGHKFTTAEVGVIAGIKRHSAWTMLNKIGRVLPLAGPDPATGRRWYMLPDDEEE